MLPPMVARLRRASESPMAGARSGPPLSRARKHPQPGRTARERARAPPAPSRLGRASLSRTRRASRSRDSPQSTPPPPPSLERQTPASAQQREKRACRSALPGARRSRRRSGRACAQAASRRRAGRADRPLASAEAAAPDPPARPRAPRARRPSARLVEGIGGPLGRATRRVCFASSSKRSRTRDSALLRGCSADASLEQARAVGRPRGFMWVRRS
jgi:hypothetical protein